jgi:hypothetical protein
MSAAEQRRDVVAQRTFKWPMSTPALVVILDKSPNAAINFAFIMSFSSKFYHLFGLVDPYKEFVLMDRTHKLLALRAVFFGISVIGFIIYAAFAFSSYFSTPEQSDLSVERIFPSSPPVALFQFSIGIPFDASTRDPLFPTVYRSPFSTTLTQPSVAPYRSSSSVPPNLAVPGNRFVYEIYTFPVYGTVDAQTSTSTVLYFEPCKYVNAYGFPLLFIVGSPDTAKYANLEVTKYSDKDYRVSQPGLSTEFLLLYDDFNQAGPEIAVSLSLVKSVSSSGHVIYNASIFGPPSLSPPTRNLLANDQRQRTIAITIRPMVNVVTYSPKNILNLLGSLAGIFPLIVSIGGIAASMMWSKLGPQNTASSEGGKSAVELNVVRVARSNDASQIEGRAASEVQVPPATNSGQQVEAAVQLNDTKVARSNDASQIEGRAASEVQVPPATNSGQQVEAAVQLNDTKVAIANDAS